ncbi:MAG: TonB family protein [Bacteroidetes bacterium]|nr:TonB family protein [Bacteroidota bacterium]
MKTKKTKRANLENYRTIFLQIGLILTLSAIFVAFEWNSAVEMEQLNNNNPKGIDIIDLPPITTPKAEEIKAKPKIPTEKFVIKEDHVDFVDEPFLIDEGEWTEVDLSSWEDNKEEIDEPIVRAQFMPTFQGEDGLYFSNYISKKVEFPEEARRNGITGTVYASFVIDKDGSVSNVEILRGVHPVIDQAVIKAIQNSPKWEPGINNGKFVRVRYSIAIAFRLE